MNKKILFILGDGVYPYRTGGMEVFNYYLIRELKNCFDIRYLATHRLDYAGCKYYRMKLLHPSRFLFPFQIFFHLLVHPSERTILISFSAAHWFIWWMYSIMIKLFRLTSITVIHYGKSVPKEHNKAYRRFFEQQKSVIAVSDDIKRNYDHAFDIGCVVIPPLVPFSLSDKTRQECREIYGIPENSNVICMVGSLKPMKNPDTLLNVIASMSEEEQNRYNIFALYAGDGCLKNELMAKASKNGIMERVRFLGNVPKEDVRYILKASDIYLIASDFEGTSVSLLEAMFNGVGIISSRVPGLVDMCREDIDALMFEVKNENELKQRIFETISDPVAKERRISSACNRYRENYDYAKMIDSYIELLAQ